MRLRLLRAVLLVCAVLPFAFGAGATEYMCRDISLAEGLSQSYVSTIDRDDVGFLWIGTRFGLNRYDSEKIKNYYSSLTDENTLPHSNIRKLFVDSNNRIFVACEYGAAIYRRSHDDFVRLYNPAGGQLNVRSFFEEENGVLIGGAGKFFFYDNRSGKITELQVKGGSTYYYTSICEWMPGIYVLVTHWDGIWLFDRAKATITRFPGVSSKNIMTAFADSYGRLWVSSYGDGISIYDRAGKLVKKLDTSNSELPNNIVLDMTEHKGRVWIGTDGGGMAVYDLAADRFAPETQMSELKSTGAVSTVFVDDTGNVYGGSVREGAFMLVPTAMRTIQLSLPVGMGSVTSSHFDDEGRLWFGKDGGGLYCRRPGSDVFEPVKSTSGMRITDMESIDANSLLVATFNQGFYIVNKNTGSLSRAPKVFDTLTEPSKTRGIALRLRGLSDGTIAIVCENIDIYNPATNELTTVPRDESMAGVAELSQPFYCYDGRLLCFSKHRVTEYNPVAGKHSTLLSVPFESGISCAAFDGMKTVYLGTDDGVLAANLDDGTMTAVAGTEGVKAHTLAIDGDRRLWIGTTQALLLKLPSSASVTGFGLSDGVSPNEYLPNSVISANGNIYMGGVSGLLAINLGAVDEIISNYEDPQLNLADIMIDGVSAYGQIDSDGVLVIPSRHSDLRMTIIDMGVNSMRRLALRYYIYNGSDERVVDLTERTLNLNLLEEGNDYEIYASSFRPDGTWTRKQHLASISLPGPWWRTWWTPVLALVILLVATVLWVRQLERKRSRIAEARIESYRNSSIERELAFLVNTNYALRTPLTLVYAPVKLLLESIRAKREPENIQGALESIYRNVKRMRDTIDMALSLHNSEAADSSKLVTHDVNRSVEDAVEEKRALAGIKHVTLSYLPSQEMFPADYDRPRLAKVLDFFLDNAIRRSPEHSSVAVKTMMHEGFVRVSVSDTGTAPDPSTLDDMFSKYFNDDNSTFSHSLEFAYAKNVVEALDGHVGAEANPDVAGLTVWLDIPAADSIAAEAYTTRRRNNTPAPPSTLPSVVNDVDTSQLTAIVVDEDSELCLFIADELSHYFGRVFHAFNGNDALALIRSHQPDIVLSSVLLPGKSGIELCRDIKSSAELSHIPVVLLTSIREGSVLESGYGVGADSYLTKPFDVAVLLMRCRNLLHNRSVIRARYADKPAVTAPARLSNADESFLIKVQKIVNDNLADEDFGVDTIVDAMALSRSAFYARFKEITGSTIGQYITSRRVEVAKEYLADRSVPISEISERLGFSSQRYFSTFFKQQTGMSPSAFRKQSLSES